MYGMENRRPTSWVKTERASPSFAVIVMMVSYYLASEYPEHSTLIYSSVITISVLIVLVLLATHLVRNSEVE